MRAHPLARAVRIDKLSLAALEATLRLHRDPERAARDIPVLQMLSDAARRARRARGAAARGHRGRRPADAGVRIVAAAGRAGGGSLPLLELEGPAVAVTSPDVGADELHARMRPGDPPIVARVRDERSPARSAHDRRGRGRLRRARRDRCTRLADEPAAPLTLGTAGHIDHGKTALIEALTGVNTDRLPQERERGISIELGFTRLALPSGRELSVVDVPGHERFVRTMVAGATGIDLFLLVVAADDGVMPQTREHLTVMRGARRSRRCRRAHQDRRRRRATSATLVAADVRALLAPTPYATRPWCR